MSSVHSALAKRYTAPQWALAFEVADSTGYGKSRSADAVAMGLWPSRGLEVHGIEIKVSRADWLRELRDPAKSAPIQRYCDRWWLAVASADIVQEGELPVTWGLLVLQKGGKLLAKVEAPELTPEPLSRGFAASMIRAFSENVTPTREVARMVNERVEEIRKRDADAAKATLAAMERRLADTERMVQEFERASGVRLDQWTGGTKIGEAVRLVLNDRGIDVAMERAIEPLERVARTIRTALDEVRALRPGGARSEGAANTEAGR
jgi:hypothetical protein